MKNSCNLAQQKARKGQISVNQCGFEKLFQMANIIEFSNLPKSNKFQNLQGKVFTRLTVIGFGGRVNKSSYWVCECECNNIVNVRAGHLKSGATTSCGCKRMDSNTKHGHTTRIADSPTYKSWENMVQRCSNPKTCGYENYGGRGIKVCDRWKKFENFLTDMGVRPEGKTLDRYPDNDGDYCQDNCRWATRKEQNSNKRNNHLLTFNGETKTVTQWASDLGVSRNTIFSRLFRGYSSERTLTTKFANVVRTF